MLILALIVATALLAVFIPFLRYLLAAVTLVIAISWPVVWLYDLTHGGVVTTHVINSLTQLYLALYQGIVAMTNQFLP